MSENNTTENKRLECTESFCIAEFRREELIAHLKMDHGYSERKAKARVEWEHGNTNTN